MSSPQPPHAGRWFAVLAASAVLVVVGLLVWPTAVDGALVALVDAISPQAGGAQGLVEFLANVALFVPLAFLVAIATRRWWLGLAVGVAVSVGGELVQAVLPNRDASLVDVIANSLGAALGAGIALAVLRRRARTAR